MKSTQSNVSVGYCNSCFNPFGGYTLFQWSTLDILQVTCQLTLIRVLLDCCRLFVEIVRSGLKVVE